MPKSPKIPYVNLSAQWREERSELLPIIESVFSKGQFVGGQAIDTFEHKISEYCKVKYCVSLNSGTDALTLALFLSGVRKGDEVITPPNSFIASTAVICHLGATPVFVDVESDQNIDVHKIEAAITKKTKVLMPVHLTGRICEMTAIKQIASKYKLKIIEDAAQAIGSMYDNQKGGSFGDIGCFSTHPLKNLNASGDGGFITTNDENVFLQAKSLVNHGIENRDKVSQFGFVSRMDTLQAEILSFRLDRLEDVIEKRRTNARRYVESLNLDEIFIPPEKEVEFNTYHTFVIQAENRDALYEFLLNRGVETAIHYPVPIHLQPAAKSLGYEKGDFPVTERQAKSILTLPINQFVSEQDANYVIKLIKEFYS